MLYIILGIAALALGIVVLIYPDIGVGTLVLLLGVGLIANGIGGIILAATAIQQGTGLRVLALITGLLALILFAIVVAIPGAEFSIIVIFLAVGLLFWGFNRILLDGANAELPGAIRALGIVVGILALIMSFLVLADPYFGLGLATFFLSFGLIFGGIAALGSGIAGGKMGMAMPAQPS